MKALKCARLAVRHGHGASWQAHDVRDPIQSSELRTHLPSSPAAAVPPPPAPGKSHNDPREGEGGQGGAVRGGGADCGVRQCGVYRVSSAQQQTWVWVLQIRTGVSAGRCDQHLPMNMNAQYSVCVEYVIGAEARTRDERGAVERPTSLYSIIMIMA